MALLNEFSLLLLHRKKTYIQHLTQTTSCHSYIYQRLSVTLHNANPQGAHNTQIWEGGVVLFICSLFSHFKMYMTYPRSILFYVFDDCLFYISRARLLWRLCRYYIIYSITTFV